MAAEQHNIKYSEQRHTDGHYHSIERRAAQHCRGQRPRRQQHENGFNHQEVGQLARLSEIEDREQGRPADVAGNQICLELLLSCQHPKLVERQYHC